MGGRELKLLERVDGADALEVDATGEGEIGFDETADDLGAGAAEATGDRLLRIEDDTQGAADLRSLDKVTMESMAEGVAAVEWVEREGSRDGLACTEGARHG